MIVLPMRGDATMPMAWSGMPMNSISWTHAAASFVAMWTVMMAAMMLPSLTPTLRRYHRALDGSHVVCAGPLTALFGVAYMSVWAAIGVVVFVIGAALGSAVMRGPAFAHAQPIITGVVVVGAGLAQFTRWKAHHLARYRDTPVFSTPRHAAMAWRDGLRLGVHCAFSCAGPTAALLAVGIMDLRAMALITAAITAERVVPAGARVARGTGLVAFAAGLLLIARAMGVA